MDENKKKTLTEIMSNPRRDECMEHLLKCAAGLAKAGYKYEDLANAALRVALHQAMEESCYYHGHFLRRMEERGRVAKETFQFFFDEETRRGYN